MPSTDTGGGETEEEAERNGMFAGFQIKDSFSIDKILGSKKPEINDENLADLVTSNNKLVRRTAIKRRSGAGFTWIRNRFSTGTELDVSIEEGDVEKKIDTLEEFSQELKEKLVFALSNNIYNQIVNLNCGNVKDYLTCCDFRTETKEWQEVEDSIREAVKQGPRLVLSGLKLPRVKSKRRVKFSCHFLDNPGNTLESEPKEVRGEEVEWGGEYSLTTPGSDTAILRLEIIKEKDNLKPAKVIGFHEINLDNFVERTTSHTFKLTEPVTKRVKINSEQPGHLHVKVRLDNTQQHANKQVPRLLSHYLVQRAGHLLGVDKLEEAGPEGGDSEKVRYAVQVAKVEVGRVEVFWRLVRRAGEEEGKRPEDGTEFLDCILTNYIEFSYSDTGRRSPSSSPSCGAPRKISEPLAPRAALQLRAPSLNNIYLIGSPSRNSVKTLPLTKLLDLQPFQVELKGSEWEVELKVFSQKKLSSEDLKCLYSRALLREVNENISNSSSWAGQLSPPVQSLLSHLELMTDTSHLPRHVTVALAYVRAFNTRQFDPEILQPKLKIISSIPEDQSDKDMQKYIEQAETTIINMRTSSDNQFLQSTLENLSILSTSHANIQDIVEKALARQIKDTFKAWRSNITSTDTELVKEYGDNNSLTVMAKLLNEFIGPDIKMNALNYMKMFSPFLNYREFIAKEFFQQCNADIKKYIDLNFDEFERSISIEGFHYDESSAQTKHLLQAYNTFSALKRIGHFAKSEHLCYILFQDYSDLWIKLALKKADYQIKRLTLYALEKEAKDTVDGKKSVIGEPSMPILTNQHSQDDPIIEQLVIFTGITESCWIFWNEMGWHSTDEKMESGLELIKGLSELERNFLNEKDKLYLADNHFDVDELGKSVKQLHGLKNIYEKAEYEIRKVFEEAASNKSSFHQTGSSELQKENLDVAINDLKDMKEKLDEEIRSKFKLYAKCKKVKIQGYLKDKRLISTRSQQDSLLDFIDNENRQIAGHFEKNLDVFTKRGITVLWQSMEEEILNHFEAKKTRNIVKNKPERFNHLKEAMEEIIASKRKLVHDEMSEPMDFQQLYRIREEIMFLTLSSSHLITKYLRRKEEEEEEEDEVEPGSSTTSDSINISYKIGFVQENNSVILEILSAKNLKPRPKKDNLHLVLTPTLYPSTSPRASDLSRDFHIQGSSHIFDYDGSRLEWEFSLNHVSSQYRENDDCFLCLDLYDKSLMHRFFLGDAVFQIVKNGMRMAQIKEYQGKDDFRRETISLTRQIQLEVGVLTGPEFEELAARGDDVAKAFVKQQAKHQKRYIT